MSILETGWKSWGSVLIEVDTKTFIKDNIMNFIKENPEIKTTLWLPESNKMCAQERHS